MDQQLREDARTHLEEMLDVVESVEATIDEPTVVRFDLNVTVETVGEHPPTVLHRASAGVSTRAPEEP